MLYLLTQSDIEGVRIQRDGICTPRSCQDLRALVETILSVA